MKTEEMLRATCAETLDVRSLDEHEAHRDRVC